MVSSEGGWPKTAGLIISIVIVALLIRTGSMTGWMIYFGAVIAGVAILAVITLFDRSSLGMKGLALIMLIMVTALGIFMLRGSMSVPGFGHLPAVIPRGGILGRILDRILDAFGAGLWWVLWVIFFPGMLAYAVLFGSSIDHDVMAIPELLFIVGVTWLFWFYLVPRFLKFIGLWDPFRRGRVLARRPGFARIVTRLGEASERARFGLGPTGGWAGLLEVLSLGYRDGDVFLGRPNRLLRPIGMPTEKHMVTISQTGAGKSTAGLVPNLCIHKGSALIVDPVGELAAITAKRRGHGDSAAGVKGLGQVVHILDPFHIVPGVLTAAYNPFDEMAKIAEKDEDRAVSYAGKMAEALVTKLNERDKYWDAASETFLRGLILLVYFTEPPENRNLVRVRDLLVEGDVEGYERQVQKGAIKAGQVTPFEALLERMYACAKKGEAGAAIAKCARSIEKMGEEQMGSVLTNAQEHTAFLDTPEIRKVCRGSSFLLSDLRTQKVTIYLCLPLNAVTGKEGRWLRMFVLLFVDLMQASTVIPETPILLAIDEFPSLGHLEGIEKIAPTLRKKGVRFWAVAQDIEQLKAVYPDSWGGFIGGAEAIQCMGITHWDTVYLLARQLGEHVVMEQQDGYGDKSRWAKAVHPLLDANQFSRIVAKGLNNQIVLRGDRRPLLLKICPYYDYLPYWYYKPVKDPRYPEHWRRRVWRSL